MKEHPILFSALMVKAILEGRKMQTRRVIKPQPPAEAKSAGVLRSSGKDDGLWWWLDCIDLMDASPVGDTFRCPYGVAGDRLWVRHEHMKCKSSDGACLNIWDEFTQLHRFSTGAFDIAVGKQALGPEWEKRVGMFLPRWASRILLEIVDVRVERVKDITNENAFDEGCDFRVSGTPNHANAFAILWDSINAKRGFSWEKNPWVWVVEFRRLP